MPSSEITLTEKIETSVKLVSTRTSASAPTMASRPTRAGIEAATRLPKIRKASTSTMGIEIVSARARSSLVISLTSSKTAKAPAMLVSIAVSGSDSSVGASSS